jgi:predicted nuclease of predicted toxin-antitoxin system
LIDEDLSPALADLAAGRGYTAISVTRRAKLRGRGDSVIARHAIDRDLVLVTNNIVDFERIYVYKEFHPGLVFIAGSSKLRTKRYQLLMMELALDEIEQDGLLQEALLITPTRHDGDVTLTLERYLLPEHQAIKGT